MVYAVAPTKWKLETKKILTNSAVVNSNASKSIKIGHRDDPLPSFHDQAVLESNTKIIKYMREVRHVVMNLRARLSESNEEIKSLSNSKRKLERCYEHTIKDIRLNKETQDLRKMKPKREMQKDKADYLLECEKKQLTSNKATLENKLFQTQEQLSQLDSARLDLNHVLDERNQVLDLISESVKPGTKVTRGQSSPMDSSSNDMIINSGDACRVDLVMKTEIRNSKLLRKENNAIIESCYVSAKESHDKVNYSLTQKVAETVALEQRLTTAECQNRAVSNKLYRHNELTKASKGYLIGAEAYDDVTTREKLTRPVVKIFHRHPGTELPEARRIDMATQLLDLKLNKNNQDIQTLRRAKTEIVMDKNDKRASSAIDCSLIRLRRQRSNHRWVMSNSKRFGSASEATIRGSVITPWYKP